MRGKYKYMLEYQQEQRSLTREQKEAVGLLSIGTFLEFFDFMLYVHMATFLNEIFFPKTDPSTATLLAAAAFCSSYVLRPIGALIFGYIGDNIGSKSTFIITTCIMAACCFTMANLPTYAQWGYTASVCMVICRVMQGLSSIGKIVGAEVYVTEMTKPPAQYPAVATIEVMGLLGTTIALIVASFATLGNVNWRIAFWFGTIIAIIGGTARRILIETPEFADAKLQLKRVFEKANMDIKKLNNNPIVNEKVNKKTACAYFLLDCSWPLNFYIAYFFCGTILKNSFCFSTEQVIHQNLMLSIIQIFPWCMLAWLSYKIHPLKLLKVKLFIFPFLLKNVTNSFNMLLIHSFIVVFSPTTIPAVPIILKALPIFKRFTCSGLIYAFSRAGVFIVCSFGLIYLTTYFGYPGLLFIMIPVSIGYIFGLLHFEKLSRETENHL
ncbi:MFS transporter [Candidatus Tisiphia endosymbiont of Myopa tessellatipennis]|uniref:MFS transporter n=1 Tax=Candidatus Tisiphia endosymbiont of Myopa tessellatipennis TaxID=3066257 RepID=UPI00313AB849